MKKPASVGERVIDGILPKEGTIDRAWKVRVWGKAVTAAVRKAAWEGYNHGRKVIVEHGYAIMVEKYGPRPRSKS